MNLPSDDYILLSVVNTKLRDEYGNFADLCAAEGWNAEEICARLRGIGYEYDPESGAFKQI